MLANHVFWRLMHFYTHLLLLLQPSVQWLSIVNFNNDAKPPPKWILRELDVPRIRPRPGGLPHLETFTWQNLTPAERVTSITSGIYAKYHVQIMLLFVYTTTHKRFVIFTCRYFKLSWNTTALSQSNCRNFSCSSIKTVHLLAVKWNTRNVKGVPFFNSRYRKEVPVFCQKCYIEG